MHAATFFGLYRAAGPVFSYKLRYIVGFCLVEMAISTKTPTIYRNLYENTGPDLSSVYFACVAERGYYKQTGK